MYLFKDYAQTVMIEAGNKQNIHENIFLKVLWISNFMLLFSAFCHMRCNVANYNNRFTALNIAHLIINIIILEGLWQQNLQFCVHVFSADRISGFES